VCFVVKIPTVPDIPKTMRAVVYRGVNDLRLETVPVPRIGPNELLVKVAVCGVCPTDIKKIQYGTVPPPRIFGHETAGVISKLGPGVSKRGWKIGDRVALHHHVPCLKCHFCRHHAFAQCETYKRTGITAGFEPAGGGYAEYVRVMPFVLPGVVKIPAKNFFAEGAMLEPVNTVLKAVRRLSLLRGDVVLVAGQGPIGLMFTRLLQLAGVQVIATDLFEPRLRLARKFGAKWTMLAQTGRAELPLRPDARGPCLLKLVGRSCRSARTRGSASLPHPSSTAPRAVADSTPPSSPCPPTPPCNKPCNSSAVADRCSSSPTPNDLRRKAETSVPTSAFSLQPSALIWPPSVSTKRICSAATHPISRCRTKWRGWFSRASSTCGN